MSAESFSMTPPGDLDPQLGKRARGEAIGGRIRDRVYYREMTVTAERDAHVVRARVSQQRPRAELCDGTLRDTAVRGQTWSVLMERRLAVVWTYLLGAGLALVLPQASSTATSEALPRPPRLIGCVFLNRANITCRWEAGDPSATHYTLKIQRKPGALKTFTCTTADTGCTADIGMASVRFTFCVAVTAHGLSGNVSSAPRCQPGRIEVMLPAAIMNSVKPVDGTPECLNLTWSRTLAAFPVSDSEIKAGVLNSQIEVTAEGQPGVQVKDATVAGYGFPVCHLRPDTSYAVRLRHRYRGPESPWSPWSNACRGRTAEDAPSAAPMFWRRVQRTDKSGRRLTSLLWKALPRSRANGRVLFYNVTCQTESALIPSDRGTCGDLHRATMSCTLLLPAERCSCALTASNSAGTSPEARTWLLGASETEPPSPREIAASPLDDDSLGVHWTPPDDPSVSGFVLEWFAVRELSSSVLHWEKLNGSHTTFVIAEGVKPMERYAVSVKALYGERRVGKNRTLLIYTRQGAPSAGPTVEVQQISGGTVELSWSPVPVELLHGFIRNYTLHYTTAHQPTRSVFVPGDVHHYSLENLSPGNHDIFMQVNTDAGTGAAGTIANVHIDSEELSKVMYAVLSLILTSLALALMACLARNKVKRKLCQFVPDPSNSSLAHWIPKSTSETMKQPSVPVGPQIEFSEVISFGEDSDPDQVTDNQSVCDLRTYSSHRCSLLPVPGSETPQNAKESERSFDKGRLRAKTTFDTDLSSCASDYSTVVFSQTLENPLAPVLSPARHQSHDWRQGAISVSDVKMSLGGGRSVVTSDPPQRHSSASLSDFSAVSPSSALHSLPAEARSPKHLFPRSSRSSGLSPQPDTRTHPNAIHNLSYFLPPVFVEFTHCPVERDPHTHPLLFNSVTHNI
ncbi:putative interleukin-6 receptor subunit beta-like [Scophthalmus maximus]|uniref:Putative interleukin-6 receptor subunit beta-like n=1 Tax=Scophthalmus maximus TaxID=52904 RepID=A0A2U9CJ83_SCOMX|nr:putative interleukin-6 receptor subunit beta-like [Scophthalmus maximus]